MADPPQIVVPTERSIARGIGSLNILPRKYITKKLTDIVVRIITSILIPWDPIVLKSKEAPMRTIPSIRIFSKAFIPG
ncbi:hypothetical protein ES703_96474 [subsurface metagenome]